MNITDFLQSLLPSFGKNRVVEDARVTYDSLEGMVIPSYVEAEKLFTGWKYRSQAMRDFDKIFKRIVKYDNDANMIVAISRGLQRISEQKEYIQDKIEASFEPEVVSTGLSCLKVNILRIVEATTFISDFAMMFLNYAYILETAEQAEDTGYVRSNLSPAEIKQIHDQFSDFCIAFNVVAKDKKQIVKAIDQIPDVLINIDTGHAVIGTLGEDKLDPLTMRGFSSVTSNPIYHIRMIVAERQIEKWKKNKELKKVLELRMLNLQMLLDGSTDAKTEKEILYIQGRIQSINHNLHKLEAGIQ